MIQKNVWQRCAFHVNDVLLVPLSVTNYYRVFYWAYLKLPST